LIVGIPSKDISSDWEFPSHQYFDSGNSQQGYNFRLGIPKSPVF
jgi:hypothetical protein